MPALVKHVYSVHVFQHIRTGAERRQNNIQRMSQESFKFIIRIQVTFNCYVSTNRTSFQWFTISHFFSCARPIRSSVVAGITNISSTCSNSLVSVAHYFDGLCMNFLLTASHTSGWPLINRFKWPPLAPVPDYVHYSCSSFSSMFIQWPM